MGTGKRAGGRSAGSETAGGSRASNRRTEVVAALFDGVLRSSRNHLLAAEQPLAAELWASGVLAIWDGLGDDTSGERAFGEALVHHARSAGTPEAAALLLALAGVAPSRLATKARTAAAGLARRGVPAPAWAAEVGRAVATDAWIGTDTYGDQEIVMIGFAHPGGDEHTVCVLVDHNRSGIARDAYPAAPLPETLARWREAEAEGITLRPVPLSEAAGCLADAMLAADFAPEGAIGQKLSEMWALLTARLAAMPGGERPGRAEVDAAAREALVAQFLSSPEAADLLAEPSVVAVCHSLVAYRCDYGDGDPLRWSPTLAGLCLLDHFPQKVALDGPDLALVPDVLAAWVRFAGRLRGLSPVAVLRTLSAVEECRADFALAMLDDSRFAPAKRTALDLVDGEGNDDDTVDLDQEAAQEPTSTH
jgi:hypothetical protein